MRPRSQRGPASEAARDLTQDLGGDRARQRAQGFEPKRRAAVAPYRQPIELGARRLVERAHGLARQGSHAHERGRDLGVVRIGEEREQLVADAIAEKLRIPVGLVLDPRKPRALELGLEGGPAELDERADDRPAHRRDSGQAAHARSLDEPHQHGLGLIVGGVSDCDTLGADSRGALLERRVPRRPRRGFEGALSIDRDRRDVNENAEPRAELPDEVGVGGRVGAQLMVHMQDVKPELPRRGQAQEEMEQRHGVRAARDGDQNGFAAREHRVAANGALQLIAQSQPSSRPGAPPRPRRPRNAPSSTPARCA